MSLMGELFKLFHLPLHFGSQIILCCTLCLTQNAHTEREREGGAGVERYSRERAGEGEMENCSANDNHTIVAFKIYHSNCSDMSEEAAKTTFTLCPCVS